MSANVHYLHGRPEPIGQFLRVGNTGYRQLETLLSTGKFSVMRAVIDAAWVDRQKDLLRTLQEGGAEIVLDTNAAELSAVGRYEGAVRRLPWAEASRPLGPADFQPQNSEDIVRQIAQFAVANGFDVVLAPTHLVKGARSEWTNIDNTVCERLRAALDAEGGKHIAIDYPLLTSYGVIREAAQRRAFVRNMRNLPFDNLWLRISGFGADASPVRVRRYISAISDFHLLDRPIIADHVGGLVGLATVAFGSCGAIAHGVAERERFDASSWHAPRRIGGGGQSGRVYIPGIDRMVKIDDVRKLMEARGGRRLLSCHDQDCCPRGAEDTLKDPKAHFLVQRSKQLDDLSNVPEERRIKRFLDHHLTSADRTARQAAKLKIGDEALIKSLSKTSIKLDKMRSVLEDLQDTMSGDYSRSASPALRVRSDQSTSDRGDNP